MVDKKNQAQHREFAKAGMVVSLGTLAVTSFYRFKYARLVHPWAGVALLGFTLWHHWLNKRQSKPSSAPQQ